MTEVITFIFGFVTAIFVDPVRKVLFQPGLKKPEYEEIVRPGWSYISLATVHDETNREMEVFYFRVKVTNEPRLMRWSKTTAENCRGYLTEIKRNGKVIHKDPIQLNWSFIGGQSLDIPVELPFYLDVATVNDKEDKLTPCTIKPAKIWEKTLKKSGKYEFSVVITADNHKPVEKSIEITWSGTFKELKALLVSSESRTQAEQTKTAL